MVTPRGPGLICPSTWWGRGRRVWSEWCWPAQAGSLGLGEGRRLETLLVDWGVEGRTRRRHSGQCLQVPTHSQSRPLYPPSSRQRVGGGGEKFENWMNMRRNGLELTLQSPGRKLTVEVEDALLLVSSSPPRTQPAEPGLGLARATAWLTGIGASDSLPGWDWLICCSQTHASHL
ncbi:uncharacterized protein LOC144455417 [Phascolarctos cinereus]